MIRDGFHLGHLARWLLLLFRIGRSRVLSVFHHFSPFWGARRLTVKAAQGSREDEFLLAWEQQSVGQCFFPDKSPSHLGPAFCEGVSKLVPMLHHLVPERTQGFLPLNTMQLSEMGVRLLSSERTVPSTGGVRQRWTHPRSLTGCTTAMAGVSRSHRWSHLKSSGGTGRTVMFSRQSSLRKKDAPGSQSH
jgi:hypothetical protein